MTIQANKKVVQSWFDAVNRGDEAAILDLTTADFQFLTMARSPSHLQYRWNRQEFAAVPNAMSKVLTAPIQLSVVNMIADDDSVAVEAETDSTML
ncbi:MAG: nuclear transport factor 2 family protein, partial [Alphaproteobacteria bacterium]|nr:nuclear transport factor 2 family protein [Alphaproteobacteria bacterium]